MPLLSRAPGPRCRDARGSGVRARRAFTLVELVLAAALAAVVLIGLQSAVVIASKAIPSATEKADNALQGAALDRIAQDLSYAKTITSWDANDITFTVADRNADAADDTITYSWTGAAAAPLLRQFNASAPETILADVGAFALSLQTEAVAGEAVYVDSSETLLASYSSASNLAQWAVDTGNWLGQCFSPSLPVGTVDYRTTRVRISLATSGPSTGTTAVELRAFRRDSPTTRVLASVSILESSLTGSMTSTSIALPSVRNIDPNEPVCLVIRPSATPPSCQTSYRTTGAAASAGAWYASANSGGTWTTTSGRALIYEVYGVCRSVDSTPTTTRAKFLLLSLRSGSNTQIELNLPLANRPQVTP